MDTFAQLPSDDKQPYFEVAAAKLGLSQDIIEKDFWVCWTLNKLFSSTSCRDALLFKGGTSLSKVYKLIERFSEDIDISIDKSYFGYTLENDPESAPSKKKQRQSLANITADCSEFVQGTFLAELKTIFSEVLSTCNDKWKIEVDASDADGQTILFHYPSVGILQISDYINQYVKIEIGARSDHWPAADNVITPFIEESSPGVLHHPQVRLKALSAERTFWEKATILHKFAHFPEDKTIPERQSRHYYDFHKLLCSDISNNAANNLELLARVRDHKNLYFRAAWANYATANKGTLKIIPGQRALSAMESDYNKMSEMFYGDKISWSEIIDKLASFEASFNV